MELKLILITGIAAAVLAGCVQRRVVAREHSTVAEKVFVTEKPPAPQVEIIGSAPSPRHTWIGGHWAREDNRWVWRSGQWELRPPRSSAYVPGHWERTRAGWVYYRGRWR